jgi:hypothetical protein
MWDRILDYCSRINSYIMKQEPESDTPPEHPLVGKRIKSIEFRDTLYRIIAVEERMCLDDLMLVATVKKTSKYNIGPIYRDMIIHGVNVKHPINKDVMYLFNKLYVIVD